MKAYFWYAILTYILTITHNMYFFYQKFILIVVNFIVS